MIVTEIDRDLEDGAGSVVARNPRLETVSPAQVFEDASSTTTSSATPTLGSSAVLRRAESHVQIDDDGKEDDLDDDDDDDSNDDDDDDNAEESNELEAAIASNARSNADIASLDDDEESTIELMPIPRVQVFAL